VLATEEDWRAALAVVEEQLAPLYHVRRLLREEYFYRFSPPALPPPRYRTEKQEKIARCPRCGAKIKSEGAPR
jgi:hypothetical protein